MLGVKLEVRNTNCWTEAVARSLSAEVIVWNCERHAKGVQTWVEILARDATAEDIVKQLSGRCFVLRDFKKVGGRIFGVVVSKSCRFWPATTEVTCLVRSHSIKRDGTMELNLILCGKHALRRLLRELRERGIHARVVRMFSRPEVGNLTPRQREALRLAFEMGYYEYPKRVSLEEIARRLGISPSTTAEIIRRAERKLIASSLK